MRPRTEAKASPRGSRTRSPEDFINELRKFNGFGASTICESTTSATFSGKQVVVPAFVNEYWTSAQRAASSLHEVSYRACFKPQLPRFFIERLSDPGDPVYDPFMGRGTTPVEAALLGRVPVGCDVNPLSVRLVRPRLSPPQLPQVAERLDSIPLSYKNAVRDDLLAFYHPTTLRAICALKAYLLARLKSGAYDAVDDWISLVALNRLTGHSPGFFSVYTLPPNQATSVKAQLRINAKRNQTPPERDVKRIILKKSKQLLQDCDASARETLSRVAPSAQWITSLCERTPDIASNSVQLVVTSPPFLDVVQYATDNWLRCWFIGVDPDDVEITMTSKLKAWQEAMTRAFRELARVLRPGGYVAFEVGEVARGTIRLEEAVLPCGIEAGLKPECVLINAQEFTKTANCWGVGNNAKGTNTNRVVIFSKAGK
ncbi:MAG: site-specific DNA-methyltransferase [Verrucomicrobia bacterium]|nr:site-specific DNA-methyltransferase [Verrucomicrobiota bacterium]